MLAFLLALPALAQDADMSSDQMVRLIVSGQQVLAWHPSEGFCHFPSLPGITQPAKKVDPEKFRLRGDPVFGALDDKGMTGLVFEDRRDPAGAQGQMVALTLPESLGHPMADMQLVGEQVFLPCKPWALPQSQLQELLERTRGDARAVLVRGVMGGAFVSSVCAHANRKAFLAQGESCASSGKCADLAEKVRYYTSGEARCAAE